MASIIFCVLILELLTPGMLMSDMIVSRSQSSARRRTLRLSGCDRTDEESRTP
jgi:hypothetical protein